MSPDHVVEALSRPMLALAFAIASVPPPWSDPRSSPLFAKSNVAPGAIVTMPLFDRNDPAEFPSRIVPSSTLMSPASEFPIPRSGPPH
jgi:hypothetical protein